MTTDNYQPCPCGSGKKIKFCKCVDQPQEYEKLLKLTQGGQELAAMERINQLLAKTPNAAWLLAMKAEISLRLSEFDTFKETVSRFYKLKPDNPLALIMRSLVSLSEGEPLTEGVRLLLEGLAESRESVHEIALDALQVLCTRLRHSPQACLRQYYLELIEKLTGGEVRVEQVDPGLPDDSILCNGFAEVDTNWHGKPWAERAQEVESLISTFRHAQAESKLRSILRDYPDQAWPLQKLLQVQMLLLDQEGATATARKLSCQRDLPEKTRDFYAALVLELEPGKPGLTCPMLSRYVELESDDQARQALSSLKSLHPLNRQEHRESMEMMAMSVGDEVPAVDMYAALATRTVANGTPYVVNVGAVSLFGKQTDKPTRALLVFVPTAAGEELFQQVLDCLAPKSELVDPSPRMGSYLSIVNRPIGQDLQENSVPLTPADEVEIFVTSLGSLPLPVLGNESLAQAAEQEPKRATVRAVLTHLESRQRAELPLNAIGELYRRLQVEYPETDIAQLETQVNSVLDFLRCDLSKTTDDQLIKLFATAISHRLPRMCNQAAYEVLARPASDRLRSARLSALQIAAPNAGSPEQLLSMLDEMETLQAERNQPVGETVIARFEVLVKLNRLEEAQQTILRALQKYPSDPHLISFVQRINQMARRSTNAVDESAMLSRMPGMRSDADVESPSSLVLPGQAEPAAETGKSKLWLPGS